MSKWKIIAVVVARPQRDYNIDILNHLQDGLEKYDYRILTFGSFTDIMEQDRNDYGEKSIYQLIPYKMLSGMIILPGSFYDKELVADIISKAQSYHVPVVSFDYNQPGIPSVVYEYENSFANMVRHVVEEHHCKRIYMFGGMKGNEYSEARIEVFKNVLHEYGLDSEENYRIYYGSFWSGPTIDALNEIENNDIPMPEAFVCANDSMALACTGWLKEHGYRVPEDIIVTGMDGLEIGRYNTPRLSTISIDSVLACQTVADVMHSLVEGNEVKMLTEVPLKLELNTSCGCNMCNATDYGEQLMIMSNRYSEMVTHGADSVRMKHILMEEKRLEMIKTLPRYLHTSSFICCNPSFWNVDSQISSDQTYDYNMQREDIEKELTVFIHHTAEGETDMSDVIFDRDDLLPNLDEFLEEKHHVVFLPMNFQNEVIGYYAFCYYKHFISIYNTSQLVMDLSTVFRVIRDKERAEYVNSVLQSANGFLQEVSIRDPLTNMLNRRGLVQKLETMVKDNENRNLLLLYCSIDMDGLKSVNDHWGHAEGDEALKLMAQVLEKFCEAHPEFACARVGGDEFVYAGPIKNRNEIPEIEMAIKSINDGVNLTSGKDYLVEFSSGYSLRENYTMDAVFEVMKEADFNMYNNKAMRKKLKMRS